MTLQWLTPWALAGLALLAVPIAIHLVGRPPRRRVVVPSLRLVAATVPRLARRRAVRDPWLLALRLGLLGAAVVAAAGPLVVSEARRAAWASRVVRAIVVDGGAAARGALEARATASRDGALASEVVVADPLDAGVGRAVAWLAQQPPARREIVFVGDGRWGSLSPAVRKAVPAAIGLRLARVEMGTPAADSRLWRGADSDGRPRAARITVTTTADGRTSTATTPVALPVIPLTLEAAGGDREWLAAVREAVIGEGWFLREPPTWQPIVLRWPGAPVADEALRALDDSDRSRLVPLAVAMLDGAPAGATAVPIAPWGALGGGLSAVRTGESLIVRFDAAPTPATVELAVRAALAVAVGQDDTPRADGGAWDAAFVAAFERPADTAAVGTGTGDEPRDARWLWLVVAVGVIVESAARRRIDTRRGAAAEGAS